MENAKLHNTFHFYFKSLKQNRHKIVSCGQELTVMEFIHNVRHYFERHGYRVSSRLADRLGMRAINVRLFFIYISFITVGLSFGVYLIIAFFLKLKDMLYTKRSSVFDL